MAEKMDLRVESTEPKWVDEFKGFISAVVTFLNGKQVHKMFMYVDLEGHVHIFQPWQLN